MNTKTILYAIFVVIWMIIVFMFSAENGAKSTRTSQGTIERFVEGISNILNIETNKKTIIEKIEPLVRKLAHYGIYLAGGVLIINFINTLKKLKKQRIPYTILLGTTYAMTDEMHQYFVPGRAAKITDVLIDTLGIITGILVFILFERIINKQRSKL